jgi:hypothetical protein
VSTALNTAEVFGIDDPVFLIRRDAVVLNIDGSVGTRGSV